MPGGLLLSDDLIFISKITGVAKLLSLEVRVARSTAAFLDLAKQHTPAGALIDLHHPGLDLPALLAALSPRPRVVAYGSHVEAATLHAAREAGCDLVLPRSKFVEQLPTALPAWLA